LVHVFIFIATNKIKMFFLDNVEMVVQQKKKVQENQRRGDCQCGCIQNGNGCPDIGRAHDFILAPTTETQYDKDEKKRRVLIEQSALQRIR